MTNFTLNEEKILNAIQKSLPFVQRPFLVLEKELKISETEIIETIKDLKQKNIIRNIAGIFDAKKLGYFNSLVAFCVSDSNIEIAKEIINSHPGVSHNYLRDHKFNIWFTIAETSEDELKKSVEILAKKSNAGKYLIFKNERMLKIGVNFSIGNNTTNSTQNMQTKKEDNKPLNDFEKNCISILQHDMPLTIRPFKSLATDEIREDDLIECAADLEERKIMRRYSAVLKHTNVGYKFNAMTTWKLDNFSDELVQPFKECSKVSHLYLRTTYKDIWEFPLFAMIHAQNENELETTINDLEKKSGLTDKLILNTKQEFKKQRVEYFSKEFEIWKTKNY